MEDHSPQLPNRRIMGNRAVCHRHHIDSWCSAGIYYLEFLICAEANGFSITFNGQQVATYQYLNNATVTCIEYGNSGYDSTLKML